MARDFSTSYRAEALAAFLAARSSRREGIDGRRKYAEAERELHRRLDGRHITDPDQRGRALELTPRPGGTVRVRRVNTEPRQPREPGERAARRAERYGYNELTREQKVEKGREIRAVLRNLSRSDLDTILAHARESWLADDDTEPTTSPATPTSTSKATSSDPTGWGADGVFRASRQQLRDPAWAMQPANQAALVKAGGKLVVIDD
jgi:hypothetical protein